MTWTEWLVTKDSRYHPDLEIQINPTDNEDQLNRSSEIPYPYRNPKTNQTDPKPNNSPMYDTVLVGAAGTSWWDWIKGLSTGCYLDFDHGHGPHALDDEGIAQVDRWAEQLPYVQNTTSKSGKGRHWNVTFSLPAKTRTDHIRNCKAAYAQISKDLGFDITLYTCAAPGAIQYIYAAKVADGGFQVIKTATAVLEIPPLEPSPPDNYEQATLGPIHREHRAWLEGRGFAEWNENKHCLNTHTAALLALHEHFTLKGEFTTVASGKGLPRDRNCAMFPVKGGAWRVVRYSNDNEPGWDKTKNGNATCLLNKATPKEKSDSPADTIVADALKSDKFQLAGCRLRPDYAA